MFKQTVFNYSSTSTTSSGGGGGGLAGDHHPSSPASSMHRGQEFTKMEENKLRDHISYLKTVRASVQGAIADLEPLHNDPDVPKAVQVRPGSRNNSHANQADLEQAVVQQELMASREERADLRARVYLLEKEKSSQELMLADRVAIEQMLRSHIQHLQEELGQVERGLGVHRHLMRNPSGGEGNGREAQLKQRVENLMETMEKITKNSDTRHKQANELIDDLKRANR